MTFVVATHNKQKLAELERILRPMGFSLVCDGQDGICLTEVEETGLTFAENAYLKAASACTETGLPAIADDSGLCVDALDGAPGIYSARYAGEPADTQRNNALLLANLKGVPDEQRTAAFHCCVACVFPDGRRFHVEGICPGKIAEAPQGTGGFGYDPLFISERGSFGLLSKEEKDAISHRGRALAAFAAEIPHYTKG